MLLSLLSVLALFCAVVGVQLAGPSGANVWGVLVFTAVAIVALQLGYMATLIAQALHASGANG
jgi:hypothetical protein